MRSIATAFLVLAATLIAAQPAAAADSFAVDSAHSSLVFKIKHMDVAYVWGRFNSPQGTIVWDSADPTKSTFEVSVNVANVDTDNQKRDDHLRQPEFFDASKFPTMTFKSTSVKAVERNKYEVTGDLTIRDVTKRVKVVLEHVGTASGERGTKTGFDGSFTINRQDFGVSYGPKAVGNDVQIFVALEANKQ